MATATKTKPPKPATRRQNQGSGHSYFLDGEKVMGVTTILKGVPSGALIPWAAGTVAEFVADRLVVDDDGAVHAERLVTDIKKLGASLSRKVTFDGWSPTKAAQILKGLPNHTRDTAAAKGTKVHGYGEQLVAGIDVEVPDEHRGYALAYVNFLETLEPDPVKVEGVVLSRRHRYMGTFDLLAEIAGLGLCLIDLKTSRSGIFDETALQVAGYRYAEAFLDDDGEEVPMPEVDWTGALWIRSDGWDLYPVRADLEAHRTFLYAREVKKFVDSERGSWVGDAIYRGSNT